MLGRFSTVLLLRLAVCKGGTDLRIPSSRCDRPAWLDVEGDRTNRAVRHLTQCAVMGSTGIKVNEHLAFLTELPAERLGDARLGCMALLETPVTRQSQMKIDVVAISRAPGAQVVNIDPCRPARRLQGCDDALQGCLVGCVHQMSNRLTQEAHARHEDIHGYDTCGQRVKDNPAGQPDRPHTDDDSRAGVYVSEQVFAIGDERKGTCPVTGVQEEESKSGVHCGSAEDQKQTEVKLGKGGRREEPGDCLPQNHHGCDGDQCAFEAGREGFDFPCP